MTLYYMLTGKVAYKVRNRQELAIAFRDQTPQPPSRLNPEISKALDGIVMKMIAVDPEGRYAEMADVLGDLRLVQDGPKSLLPQDVRGNERSTASVHVHQVRTSTDLSDVDIEEVVLGQDLLTRTDRARGKFRTFLRRLGILIFILTVIFLLWAAGMWIWRLFVDWYVRSTWTGPDSF